MSGANGNGATPDPTVHETLAEALVAAQADMPAVEPDAVNPHFKSRFVSLGHLVAKVRPVLNRHGIAVAQFPSSDEHGKPTLITLLVHGKSGERLEYPAPLLLSKNDAQGQGSAITYMRRYALAAALGIVDQEDDDGNASTQQAQSKAETVATIPAARAVDIAERAHLVGVHDKLQLAASHAHGADVGSCDDLPAAIKAMSVLTEPQAAKVEAWLSKKADEIAAVSA